MVAGVFLRQFYIERFVLFVVQKFGDKQAGKLVFFVDMGFFSPFLDGFQIIFVNRHFYSIMDKWLTKQKTSIIY
ncbi:MAG: hypothetical protein UT92_C0001G0036 [Candidatus Curtissbacteria bacterium GW2011_GWA1_40_24]|uniref:Uncharacterized protein n=2 Tax=Patescibacteria group TaxID=1783273 RepID=A0A0G0RT46_9BACT|nr:MAG: hypothetical protein UT92_C0001G0036 [Candidatus Curtissbacteria bacterium GW2011_GWA1_40_24]KKR89033.1 MAG: hypothetical protein UU38_C0002G0036 [Candidatus Wolfebacteria bacterium GW2011_GWB1_41_12]